LSARGKDGSAAKKTQIYECKRGNREGGGGRTIHAAKRRWGTHCGEKASVTGGWFTRQKKKGEEGKNLGLVSGAAKQRRDSNSAT